MPVSIGNFTKKPHGRVILPLTLEVTQHDIDHGITRDCQSCPVALSATRATNGLYVSCGETTITIDADSFFLPDCAMELIENFDYHTNVKNWRSQVKPITFTLTEKDLIFG